MEKKHTPGPWNLKKDLSRFRIVTDTPFSIAIIENKYRFQEINEANARLIAAAPDLLEGIIELLDAIKRCEDREQIPSYENCLQIVSKAIKKATE